MIHAKIKGHLLVVLTVAAFSAAPLHAEGQSGELLSSGDQMTPGDRRALEQSVITLLHKTNVKEMALGDLAAEKSKSKAVLDYASQLKREHADADMHLIDLARNEGLLVPAPVAFTESDDYKKLQKLNAADFDRDYLTMMQKGHAETIDIVAKDRDQLPNDSRIKEMLTMLLPTLHHHEQMALRLERHPTQLRAR